MRFWKKRSNMEILDSIWEYIINNSERIYSLNKVEFNDIKSNFRQFQKKIDIATNNKTINKDDKEQLENYKSWILEESYYVLNPWWKAKQ